MGVGPPRLNVSATARFSASWQAIAPVGTVGLAVSGGPDSMALLLLFHEVAPRNFHVATVDHGLRAESAAEAAAVAQVCADRGIAHTTLGLSLAKGSAVQERARLARYGALADWASGLGLSGLVTAHHADDQAETLVMRMNRAAGLRGLAGMRAVAPLPVPASLPDAVPICLLRPLLAWRRSELLEVVVRAGIHAADDPSNHNADYERVRVRNSLASTPLFDVDAVAATANHLADADAAIEWAVDQLWAQIVCDAGGVIWDASDTVPKVLALRVLERILRVAGAPHARGPDLVRWLETLESGGVSTLGGIKGDARNGPWRFTRAPDHRT